MNLRTESTPVSARSSTPGQRTDCIRMREVRFAWKAGAPDVIVIDELCVAKGERLFMAGPSGSGKSTLLSILGGVVTPRTGRVEIIGHEVSAMRGWRRDRFRADHVGFLELSLQELLRGGVESRGRRATPDRAGRRRFGC